MLVYCKSKSGFLQDVTDGVITDLVATAFASRVHAASPSERNSWQNSLYRMFMVLQSDDIPDDSTVAIEFGVPYTSSRIDVVLTGERDGKGAAVIVELKQWSALQKVANRDALVRTFVGQRERDVPHPSYQAWSYAEMIENYNLDVRERQIALNPCAYLHNYTIRRGDDPVLDDIYRPWLDKAPVFGQRDLRDLRAFICRNIARADSGYVIRSLDAGKLSPSKSLQDALAGMLDGNPEFVMIDDQKVVFEEAIHLARKAARGKTKQVLIVRGGPGTGKSVVAVNLLVRLTNLGMACHYVSKNSAPRHVYSRLLLGKRRKNYIDNLFKGSGGFVDVRKNTFDALVVDEAHRLNEKSGLYGNLGDHQVKELVRAARCTVFFIDDAQRVTINDIGTAADIAAIAQKQGATVTEMRLESQFRCNGSDSYLDWLDDVLGITSAPRPIAALGYDFKVFDDPNEMFREISEKNRERNKARVLAGYCWNWPKKTQSDPGYHDIQIPTWKFYKSWNLGSTQTWAIDENSVEQVGCVHTAQGLEFDYVGIIVGDDLRFENGQVVTDYTRRARTDNSLKGIKKLAKTDPTAAQRIADRVIRNTYRVLMTRGLKGCYVFCTDTALAAHISARLPHDRKESLQCSTT